MGLQHDSEGWENFLGFTTFIIRLFRKLQKRLIFTYL